MRPVATDVAWSVCLSVCLLVKTLSPAKRLHRSWCRLGCGLSVSPNEPRFGEGRIPQEKSNFGGFRVISRPNLNYREHPVRVDILNLIRLRRQQRCELSLSALQQLVYYVCGRLGWPVCSLDRVVCHEVITSLFCFLNCLSGGCSTSPVHAPVSLLYQYIITRSHRMHAAYIVTHVPRLVICAFACIGHTGKPVVSRFRGQTLVGPRNYAYVLDGVHIGATWRTRLNDLCAAAMRSYVKLL